jgi:ceramide glucosyltransferase
MLHALSVGCLVLAGLGFLLLVIQLCSMSRHVVESPPAPARCEPISVLKPLCGVDDDLAKNLEAFARLDYPAYEVLLGVRDVRDAAYPIALACARRHVGRVRVVLQEGAVGLNPKVNQLVTLARHARHDWLVVSDSNVRVGPGYLRDIAGYLADPTVGAVTHPIAGVGEARLGAAFDNLHMSGSIGPGMIAAERVGGKPLVVGKSMALRRADLDALGGFAAAADVLAEDYWFGARVQRVLGKRIAVAHRPVENVTQERSLREFLARYRRWSVMHRQQVGVTIYAGELLLNPLALVAAAVVLAPTGPALAALAPAAALKCAIDARAVRVLRGQALAPRHVAAIPLKDALIAWAWAHGLVARTIDWRGHKLRVGPGTVLSRPAPGPAASRTARGSGTARTSAAA